MSAPVPPGAPRQSSPSPPPGVSLSQNFQNLHINQPQNAPPSSLPFVGQVRPPPPGQTPPFSASAMPPPANFLGPSPIHRPGPPPPGVVPRSLMPPSGPPQSTAPPNMAPGRPASGPLASQPPFSSRPLPPRTLPPGGPVAPPASSAFLGSQVTTQTPSARAGGFLSRPLTTGPLAPPLAAPGQVSNGPPMFASGTLPSGPRFPTAGVSHQPPAGVPPVAPPPRAPPQAPMMHSLRGIQAAGSINLPPSAPPSQPTSPYATAQQPGPPPSSASYGLQPWQTQQRQMAPPVVPGAGSAQAPRMFGMPPPPPNQTMSMMPPAVSQTGTSMTGTKIDPNQIPRPIPSSSVILHETRQGNQAIPPPPATVDYIVRDTGNCSPRYMRCTINQVPCTADLLGTSGMQLALLVQPLALPHPSEEPIQLVNFGESGPVRCSRCKGYINPFMKFIDQGRRFICNFCGFTDETPRDYHCNLGPDGRRRDADERPELCRGTVEFVASKDYMVRDPMPAVFFFLIDVSMNAVQTGATAAACSAISQAVADLPEGPRTFVGIATFDATIHFYNLKRALQQPLMLIVPDVQDVYTPLETDVIVQLSECRQHLGLLLDSIPTMFQSNKTADSVFGAAIKAAFLAMKSSGGKLLVFQSVLPSLGIGALSAREAEGRSNTIAGEKEAHKLLQPADKTLREMALEFAEYQVCVDLFITTQSYVDIASMSVVPRSTGGQVYYYYPFSAVSDTAKLYNDLRWNVTRPQGFEAVMRVRCSQGLQVQEYSGNFCKRIPTDVDLPGVDCDKTIMVTLKHDDKLQDGSECAFQCALLYTTVYGERRIRVINLSLPCTSMLSNLFRSADLDTQFTCFLKQAANAISQTPLLQVREQVTNHCVNILHSYRKFCATVSSSGQLILPEALKLLPLYTLAMIDLESYMFMVRNKDAGRVKSFPQTVTFFQDYGACALIKGAGLRTDGRIDDRSYWINYVSSLATALAVPLVYPRMISIHDLGSKGADESLVPEPIPLSSEHLSDEGIYLLENGLDALIYIGSSADPQIIQQLFGAPTVDEIPAQFVLQQYESPLSKKLNEVLNEIRRQRCSYLRLKMCKKGDPSGMLFFSYMMEDKSQTGLSYVEFLVHVHRQIQSKMT